MKILKIFLFFTFFILLPESKAAPPLELRLLVESMEKIQLPTEEKVQLQEMVTFINSHYGEVSASIQPEMIKMIIYKTLLEKGNSAQLDALKPEEKDNLQKLKDGPAIKDYLPFVQWHLQALLADAQTSSFVQIYLQNNPAAVNQYFVPLMQKIVQNIASAIALQNKLATLNPDQSKAPLFLLKSNNLEKSTPLQQYDTNFSKNRKEAEQIVKGINIEEKSIAPIDNPAPQWTPP